MPQPQCRFAPAAVGADEIALLENSSAVAAVAVATDGRILAANARMRAFLGSTTHLKTALVNPADWDVWADAPARGRPLTLEMRGAAGSVRTFRGDVRAVADGDSHGFVAIFADANDERSLRTAAPHSGRMEALGSLTAGVAHDFNNLLTVLVGNLYLLGEDLRERPKAFAKLKAARDAANRGAELIKQLLAFARREEIAVETIELPQVVAGVEPLLRRALGARILLQTAVDGSAGAIRASAAQLESVIVNLAMNARDAIPGNGRIEIAVRSTELSPAEAARQGLESAGAYVAVSVSDNGNGIPPEIIERVFEPFFSTKTERGGTGLGLSMVRWFAEHAGGVVRIASTLGEGTTVTLLLPELREQATNIADRTMPLSTLPTGNERIVVLAPDEALYATLRQILEVLGYTVGFAACADDLLRTLKSGATDVVIVDGAGRDDADALYRARELQPGLAVIMTGDTRVARERLESLGAVMLTKPFSLADLAGMVRRTLDAAHAQRA